MIELDIETEAIQFGGPLLPEPVGCALGVPGQERRYYAWGHPEGNNCTKAEFKDVLQEIWHREWVTHNGLVFDVPVLTHHFALPERDPLLTHDTLFESYLHNPHAKSLSLKPLSEEWLGMPPDEQTELYDWILANVAECRARSQCGEFIARAPAGIVGKYAIGDIERTRALHEYVSPLIAEMQEPYDRERRLAPILADIQNRGVRVDLPRLLKDYLKAMEKLAKITQLIRERLGNPTLNPGSDNELADALIKAGFKNFLTTPTGKVSVAKPSLEQALQADPELMSMLKTRSTYETLTGTFMWPWIQFARDNNGRVHAGYNQVRNPDGFGTRTGRLSSSKPNFQNVPNDLGEDYWKEPYPEMRSYLLPEEGHKWICGDFKNQEPRLAAHFEDGAFCRAFNEDPLLDPYIFLCDVASMPHSERKKAKQIYLGLLYAMGVASLADKLGITDYEATVLRNIIKASIPDIVALDNDCKRRFKKGLPIRTLGGRLYFCEPPTGNRTWDYKALNTLIQGSAADQTKEAMVYADRELRAMRYDADKKLYLPPRLLGTVHDEYSISAPDFLVDQICDMMQKSANALPCDVPMLMDIATGNNWAEAA